MAKSPTSNYPRPKAGDVVLCRFPRDLIHPAPGPKPRPGVVLEVRDGGGGPYQVVVCYGTSNTSKVFPWDFVLEPATHPDAFKMAGLVKATKFDLVQRIQLPYDSTWFEVPELRPHGLTPKLGELQADVVPALIRAINASKKKR